MGYWSNSYFNQSYFTREFYDALSNSGDMFAVLQGRGAVSSNITASGSLVIQLTGGGTITANLSESQPDVVVEIDYPSSTVSGGPAGADGGPIRYLVPRVNKPDPEIFDDDEEIMDIILPAFLMLLKKTSKDLK